MADNKQLVRLIGSLVVFGSVAVMLFNAIVIYLALGEC